MKKITEKEIHAKLVKHHAGRGDETRKLIRHINKDGPDGAEIGSVFYSLSGSPPKGYAIYIPESHRVNLYDSEGKRFREMCCIDVVDEKEKEITGRL